MSIHQLPEIAPDFTLDHKVSLSEYRGRRLVITFGGRDSAGQLEAGIGAIRQRFDPDELTIVGVSDLRAVPRPARMLVKGQMKKGYERVVKSQSASMAAAGKPERPDAIKDVIMLMDWSGGVTDRYGLEGADKEAVAVAVDADGRIIGTGSGGELGPQILAVLNQ